MGATVADHVRWAATACVAGILTLGVEIVVGRLLAPFFGSSLYQWAAMIGVALLAYAAGYWSFRQLLRYGIGLPVAVGGLYVLSLPLWLHETVNRLLFLPMPVATVASAILAIGLPSLLWACVLPQMQRLAGEMHSSRMLAWAAGGNLIGAWGVAFWAVPQLGTRNTLLSIGIIAILLGLAWARSKSPRELAAMATMCLIAGALFFFSQSAHRVPEELVAFSEDTPSGAPVLTFVESSESPYQAIEVWDEQFKKETRRALLLNGTLQFSWNRYQPLTAGRRYEFYNYMTAAALWGKNAPAKRVLILGLGGGLIHWQMEQFFPEVEIVTYELDPSMAEIAKRLLPLSATTRTETLVGDGRILLQQDGSKYDMIVLDTYLNSYVPFHLTTREFFALAARRLNPGGILLANFHSIFSSSGLLPKLEATISSVFPTVSAVPLAAGITLVIASSTPARLKEQMAANAVGFPPDLQRLTREAAANLREAASADEGVELLTDDRNDTEQRLYDTRKLIGELPSPLTSNL